MAPGSVHQYCLAAINPIGYSHEGYISNQSLPSSCASFKIKWESILTGRVALGPTVGSLPVEGLSLCLSPSHTSFLYAPSKVLNHQGGPSRMSQSQSMVTFAVFSLCSGLGRSRPGNLAIEFGCDPPERTSTRASLRVNFTVTITVYGYPRPLHTAFSP